MSNAGAAYPLSDAEARERAAMLKGLAVNFARADAEIIPLDHEVRKRRPLGLAPVGADDSSYLPLVAEAFANISPEGRAAPATVENTIDILDIAIRATFDGDDNLYGLIVALRGQVSELKLENARARALVAELKSQVSELAFVSERLRVEARGPAGERGPLGRDGPPGPRGETGRRGERGEAAPAIVAWEIDDSAFVAYPLLSTGHKGPGLHLRGMFEVYNEQVNDTDAAAEVDAAARSREAARREVEAKDWANR
jgi:hypothetical protein